MIYSLLHSGRFVLHLTTDCDNYGYLYPLSSKYISCKSKVKRKKNTKPSKNNFSTSIFLPSIFVESVQTSAVREFLVLERSPDIMLFVETTSILLLRPLIFFLSRISSPLPKSFQFSPARHWC